MIPVAPAAVVIALVVDLAVGEIPRPVHPVALLGRAVAPLDRRWPAPRLAGLAIALLVPLSAALVVAGAVEVAGRIDPLVTAATAGAALVSTTSLRMLISEAGAVIAASEADVGAARNRLPALVGRDPTDLAPPQIRSAAVESAAENLADGLVAPLGAFVLLAAVSPAAGAGAAAWVKAVNTLDSTLGYPDRPHGSAVARLDDVVMWVPARIAALLIVVPAIEPSALLRARQSAGRPASPNSGWPMATLGVVTGARLEKPGGYRLDGGASLPTVAQADRGVRVVAVAGLLAFAIAAGLAGVMAWL